MRVQFSLWSTIAAAAIALSVVTVSQASSQAAPGGTAASPVREPTIGSTNERLDTLSRSAEILAEKYNGAVIAGRHAQLAASAANGRAALADRRLDEQRRQFAVYINDQYRNGPQGSATALLTSRDQGDYLNQLATAEMITRLESDRLSTMESAESQARAARDRAGRLLEQARERTAHLQRSKRAVEVQTAKLTTLLRTLTDRQRQAYNAQSSGGVDQTSTVRSVKAGSAAAQRAVDFALAQVGKPYVFGAAGPDSFDCSGLTMAAWQRGGVSLPHLASSQFNYGRRVGADELQPGDLVFLYEDLSHVSMYIGNGMLVSAPQPGDNVKIVPFSYFRSDFVGGSRPA